MAAALHEMLDQRSFDITPAGCFVTGKAVHDSDTRMCMAAALYLLLGRVMLPPGEGWALFLLWVCAHVGGFVASKVNLPPLLGMLVAGIILRNIPQGPVPPASPALPAPPAVPACILVSLLSWAYAGHLAQSLPLVGMPGCAPMVGVLISEHHPPLTNS